MFPEVVTVATVNEHLRNILDEGEVQPGPTIRKFRIVRREGPRDVEREIEHYNLDAILAVGYRVRSERGTQFRRWATERLGRRGTRRHRRRSAFGRRSRTNLFFGAGDYPTLAAIQDGATR